LLGPRGESQATDWGAVQSGETAVGGGVERLHRNDVVADPANASKVRIDAGRFLTFSLDRSKKRDARRDFSQYLTGEISIWENRPYA
jgi:hypothetical protein